MLKRLFLLSLVLGHSWSVLSSSNAVIRGAGDPQRYPTAPKEGKWVKEKSSNGFTIYTRDGVKTDILPIKAEGVINAPIDRILEVLRRVDGSERWTPDLIKKTTLQDLGPRAAITYSLTDMPWPIYDRRLILHNELLLDKKKELLFVMAKTVSFNGAPQPKKTIEAFIGYANMGFRPVSKDSTYVELTAFIDPRGSIPSWIINFYQISWPVGFFKALEKEASKEEIVIRPGLKEMLVDLLKIMQWDTKTFD
jgi:hypothetical protein